MSKDQSDTVSTDYLQKFSYRPYEGDLEPRWKRVLHLIKFEVVSTWKKSKFAKALIVIIIVLNFIAILAAPALAALGDEELMHDALNEFVSNYLSIGDFFILSNADGISLGMSMNIGILLIAVFGIAGSAFFADDKFGKIIEIYLARLQKKEYVAGKIGAIMVYINIFFMIPLLCLGILYVQALGLEHLEYLDFYLGIIIFSFLTSLILGLFILALSASVEKHSYAALIFFLIYLFVSIIGGSIAMNNVDNEFLYLISPSNFFILLSYVCLGDYSLGVYDFGKIHPLDLNDGTGLEYWHVLLLAFLLILIFSLYLTYKIRKLTTEEL